MTARLTEATVKASGSRRHAYSTPRLVRYGPLRSVTTSGSSPGNENGMGNDDNKKSIPRP
jgi:hypothetical protein